MFSARLHVKPGGHTKGLQPSLLSQRWQVGQLSLVHRGRSAARPTGVVQSAGTTARVLSGLPGCGGVPAWTGCAPLSSAASMSITAPATRRLRGVPQVILMSLSSLRPEAADRVPAPTQAQCSTHHLRQQHTKQ
ncbi:hypothetical protein SSCG_03611 [Streptomyces clavuligerus]|nr:hypothetical protein SSCG_03611 [Streptomyces clavuligerus]